MVSYRESMVNYEDVLHLHLNLHVDLELSSWGCVGWGWNDISQHWTTEQPRKSAFQMSIIETSFFNDLKWDKIMHMLLLLGGREKHLHILMRTQSEQRPFLAWLGPWLSGDLTNSDTPPIREIRGTHICIYTYKQWYKYCIICNLGWHDLKQAHIIVYKSLVQNAGKPP